MLKRCTSCGIERPVDNFRPYYNRSTGRYPYCKECERIETRRKYLSQIDCNEQQKIELSKIEQLYDLRQAAGLRVPSRKRQKQSSVESLVDSYINPVN